MTTIIWSTINAKSTKKAGTLAELNCAVLPTKSAGASDDVMLALSTLEKAWKSLCRNGRNPSEVNRQAVVDHVRTFLSMSGLDSNWDVNFIAAAGAKYRKEAKTHGEDCVLSGLPTFKKSMLRMAIWAQAHGNVCTIDPKEKTNKGGESARQCNLYADSAEIIALRLGIDIGLATAMKAQAEAYRAEKEKAAQAC